MCANTEQNGPEQSQQRLQEVQREIDNLVAAIRQGIITPSTRAALEDAETRKAQAEAELRAAERMNVAVILPRAADLYRKMVAELGRLPGLPVPEAQKQLKSLLGDAITLYPVDGFLEAEIKAAPVPLLRLAAGETVTNGGGSGGRISPAFATRIRLRPADGGCI